MLTHRVKVNIFSVYFARFSESTGVGSLSYKTETDRERDREKNLGKKLETDEQGNGIWPFFPFVITIFVNPT